MCCVLPGVVKVGAEVRRCDGFRPSILGPHPEALCVSHALGGWPPSPGAVRLWDLEVEGLGSSSMTAKSRGEGRNFVRAQHVVSRPPSAEGRGCSVRSLGRMAFPEYWQLVTLT